MTGLEHIHRRKPEHGDVREITTTGLVEDTAGNLRKKTSMIVERWDKDFRKVGHWLTESDFKKRNPKFRKTKKTYTYKMNWDMGTGRTEVTK